MRITANLAGAAAVLLALVGALGGIAGPAAAAAECGGGIACQCGDTVTSDYAMTSDLGPCPRLPDPGADTVGLRLAPGVTLDCQAHVITGPGDTQKDAFGLRVGTAQTPTPDSHVTIRNCGVTKFWWGVYVVNTSDVVIDAGHLYENGWKVPVENGSGYGLAITNSQDVTVRDSLIADNGNEGIHLSGSSGVTVDGNVFSNNGFEQLYLLYADGNVIRRNRAEGGTQGLEMRFSNDNAFSYNVWAGSPAQVLENDNSRNVFFYEHFEGRVVVGAGSPDNVFQLSEFDNPAGTCLAVAGVSGTSVYKSYFRSCAWDLKTSAPVTLDRSVSDPAKVSKAVTITYPGCTADLDLDAYVGAADRAIMLAAMASVIGDPRWNPEADLDHDGDVDADDLLIFDGQAGPCAPNLAVTALSAPPAAVVPGTAFSVTDTVQNLSRRPAGASRVQYYLSLDVVKGGGGRLLGGRAVPSLGADGVSTATVTVTVPSSTPAGAYFVLACADDTGEVAESDETDNCRASTASVQVGRPDLVASVSDPPATAVPGSSFAVTDTVRNQSVFPAGASRTQYYLSADPAKGNGDRLLSGSRSVPGLGPGLASTGTVTVTIPSSTSAGAYFLLACADHAGSVAESDEANNCGASAASVRVGKPNLVTTAVSDPPASARRGSRFPVTDTVVNQSAFAAGASRTRYYLSVDALRNSKDRLLSGSRAGPALAPSADSTGTVTVTIPSSAPDGIYFLLACADDTGTVGESNESDNCLASAGTVAVRP